MQNIGWTLYKQTKKQIHQHFWPLALYSHLHGLERPVVTILMPWNFDALPWELAKNPTEANHLNCHKTDFLKKRLSLGLSSSFCTMPFKCPSMPFQIAFLYDIILRGMPFQMPFQIDVKLFERAFGRACPSTFYHTKGQFERALKGIWWYDIWRAFTI